MFFFSKPTLIARRTMNFLQEADVDIFHWPLHSRDFNFIEHMLDMMLMSGRVHKCTQLNYHIVQTHPADKKKQCNVITRI